MEQEQQTLYQPKKGSTPIRLEHPKAWRKIHLIERAIERHSIVTKGEHETKEESFNTNTLPKKGSTPIRLEHTKARRKIHLNERAKTLNRHEKKERAKDTRS